MNMTLLNESNCKKDLAWICLFGLIVYFAGTWMLPVTDPVESNYTLTAKEMLESGDWVSPRIYGDFWYDKPAFFYWELIAAFSIFGVNDFAARFFPVCFSIANLVMTYLFGRKLFGERAAFCGTIIMGSSLEFLYLSKAIITDMSLFLFSNSALVFFYIGYTEQKRWMYYLCWAAGALATLTKGPVGLLMPGLIIVLFLCIRRDFREILRLKLITGFLLFFAIGGPWYYQMYTLHGMDFINGFLGTHNVLRATVSEHPKDDVFWYYTAIFIAGFIPWSFSLVKLRLPIFTKKFWTSLPEDKVFLLTWALTVIFCYQMAATKYITYTLPSMLPLALLFGLWLKDRESLVKKVAITCGVLFSIASCTIIPSFMYGNVTAKLIGEQVPQHVTADEPLYSFGYYQTSLPYYSNHKISKLEHIWSINDHKPKAMSWDIKNVMPFAAIEELPLDKPSYIIVNKHQLEGFQREFTEANCTYEILEENDLNMLVRMNYKGLHYDGTHFSNIPEGLKNADHFKKIWNPADNTMLPQEEEQ